MSWSQKQEAMELVVLTVLLLLNSDAEQSEQCTKKSQENTLYLLRTILCQFVNLLFHCKNKHYAASLTDIEAQLFFNIAAIT